MRTRFKSGFCCLILIIALSVISVGCKDEEEKSPPLDVKPLHGRIAFEQPQPITEKGDVLAPALALDPEGNAHIAYLLGMGNLHRAYYIKSNNLSLVTQLSDKDGTKSGGVSLHSQGNNIYSIWTNKTDGASRLVYKKSSNFGRNFSREDAFNEAKEPYKFAVTGDESSILTFYLRRDKAGAQLILNNDLNPDTEVPLITSDNFRGINAITGIEGTYVVAVDRPDTAGGGKFVLLKTSDGGKNFTTYDLFNAKLFPLYRNVFEIAVSTSEEKDTLHIVWLERDGPGVKLLYSRTEDSITKWSQPLEVVSVERAENWICLNPLLITDGFKSVLIGYAHLNQADGGGYRMAHRFSEDSGMSFAEASNITENVTDPGSLAGAMSRHGAVHIVWDDEDYGEPGERRIYYIRGTLRG